MPTTIDDALILTCFGCGKKLRAQASNRGRTGRCSHCGELFKLVEDDSPERMVEVWFSKQAQFALFAIDRVIHFVDRAKKSLDVAIYSMTHDWLKMPFESAHKRGVKIRILMDRVQAGGKHADDEFYAGLGIEVARDVCSGLMHHKFAIRDGKCVLTGSYNWTKSADESNRENFMILHYPHVVRQFQTEFDQLWTGNCKGIVAPPVNVPVASASEAQG